MVRPNAPTTRGKAVKDSLAELLEFTNYFLLMRDAVSRLPETEVLLLSQLNHRVFRYCINDPHQANVQFMGTISWARYPGWCPFGRSNKSTSHSTTYRTPLGVRLVATMVVRPLWHNYGSQQLVDSHAPIPCFRTYNCARLLPHAKHELAHHQSTSR